MKRDIAALTGREHDLVVIGGGILGAACCWDAAQRGLRVALLEAADFCSGTSWNSLKTIHGGLRYLQKLDLVRTRQSIGDRRALLRIAPELVAPLPFVIPTYGHGRRGREALAVGLAANDLIAWDRNRGLSADRAVPPSRSLSRAELLELMPGVERRGLTGGALWYDAQVASSERLALAFLLQAAEEGAAIANYVEVTGLRRDGARVTGVTARDGEAGQTIEIRAAAVLAAVGPGTGKLLALAGIQAPPIPLLRAVNLVLRHPALARHALGGTGGGRYVFMVPWRDRTMLGTAYEPEERGSVDGTVEALLRDAETAFPWAGLSREDVTLVHCGLVPGARGAEGLWTRDLLRDHAGDGAPGLLSVLGVKYTTARAVAADAVDLAFHRLGRRSPPCRTAETPLSHARLLAGALADRAHHAVSAEMAVHLSDALLRRLDLGTGGRPEDADVETVAGRMGGLLGWSPERTHTERAAASERLALGIRA